LSAKDGGAEVLMRYGTSNGWLDHQPAAITRKVGKGRITYIGAWLDEATMQKAAQWMIDVSGVQPALGLVPQGVDVYPRYGADHTVFILVNFRNTKQTVNLPNEMQDLLEGTPRKSVTLPQYGVAVLMVK
jgi:beta-galactosidase